MSLCFLLLAAILTPAIGSFVIASIKPNIKNDFYIRVLSLAFSFLSFVFILLYGLQVDFRFGFVETGDLNLSPVQNAIFNTKTLGFFKKLDGLSYSMISLTGISFIVAILSCFNSVKQDVKKYMILFLILESTCIAFFAASNLLTFYIFFEAGLIPMFLMIGIWGGKDKIYAAYKFFIYTFAGSVFLLIAIIYLYVKFGTLDISSLIIHTQSLGLQEQICLWLCFALSLSIKIPLFPFHTWLPDAHVQAPTSASVILAAILIKMGGYGFIRFAIPAFEMASLFFQNAMITLGCISIIYGSFVAIKQTDIKKTIAYSSVAHMGFVVIGLFSLNEDGTKAAIFQMISHGLISSALFLSIGVLYERLHTREYSNFGGIADKMPSFAFFLMLFTMASVGLPTTSGFVGEFMSILSVFGVGYIYSALSALGVIFGCVYMLYLYRSTMFGKITNPEVHHLSDLNLVEKCNFTILGSLIVILGIYPKIVLSIL
jgi:NADH-quinone oxidoreductase subunit M